MTPVTSLGPLVEIEKELRGYLSGGDDSWLHPYKEGRSAYLSVVSGGDDSGYIPGPLSRN